MPKYPVLKAYEIIKILKILGFYEVRQKGSHKHFKNKDGKTTTIPIHKNRDISPILLKQILNEIDSDLDIFCKYL
jgi:predicted RNA binding protein YcfA (HicA-like mRNA interferase family)